MPFVKRHRTYYKYGTEPNVSIVGSPTISNGVVSGFSNSNYLTINKTFPSKSQNWVIEFQFSPSGTNTGNTVLFDASNNTSPRAITMYLSSALKMCVGLSDSTSSYNIKNEGAGSFTFIAGKVYKYKLSFSGSVYKGEVYDAEKGTWTTDFTQNSTTPVYSSNLLMIGQWQGKTAGFYGSIDLKQSYIKINNKMWWHGTKAVELNLNGEDVYEDWTQPVLTANGVIGGDKFAVEATSSSDSYRPYYAYDGTNNYWIAKTSSNPYTTFYNPNPLKVTNLRVKNPNYSNTYPSLAGTVYGSNDNSSWTEITKYTNSVLTNLAEWDINLSSNNNHYKYYKIQNTTSHSDWVGFSEIKITAKELKAVGGTVEDADDYVDHNKLYQLVQNGKQYFKYAYRVNTSIVGSPTINNCVVSGFSSSNYLNFPAISIGSEPWEIVFKVTTGSSTGNNQGLFGITGTGYTRCDTSNNKLRVLLSNSSSSFNIGEIASRTLSANTTYWFKIIFTGSSYNMYSSTDGKNYTLDQSISSTAKTTFASGTMIGRARDGVWGGSIDLKESYIKINDKVVWNNIFSVVSTSTDYDYYTNKLLSYAPIVRGERYYFKQNLKQRDTGTYTFTLNKEYTAKMLFVGNGGGGCSSQKDSQWHYSGGGSGACFEGLVKLPAGTYTLTIGELGYGNNRDNVHYHSSTVVSTDSYLTNSAGQELIRVGAGGNGYTSVGGVSGAAGVLKLGTLNVLETKKAVNGNTQVGKTAATNYSLSAYDGTATGYGAGTGAERYEGNVYGIKGIFDLALVSTAADYDFFEDMGTKFY